MTQNTLKKVVVMGGGTGIYPVVSGLKVLPVDLSTIVSVSDSGGSTGRIRDEFGFPPVGDLRQSLAALAEEEGGDWIRKVLLYRFEKGVTFKGHNLGNLILTALQDMTGSTTKALEIAEKIFRLNGNVIPVTEKSVQLKITYQDGSQVVGEHILDSDAAANKKIKAVSLEPPAPLNPAGAAAIQKADVIIIGPGDYYASLMAVLVATGIPEAFAASKARILYVVNLMTRSTQTSGMSAADLVSGIEKTIGKPVDHILINADPIPQAVLDRYAAESEYPVTDDLQDDQRVLRRPLLDEVLYQQPSSDTAHRSLLRHSRQKLQQVLEHII
jgi:uncharacterized cofD-like protein